MLDEAIASTTSQGAAYRAFAHIAITFIYLEEPYRDRPNKYILRPPSSFQIRERERSLPLQSKSQCRKTNAE
jgi:hypothetical protein